jgi:hypothetical protein
MRRFTIALLLVSGLVEVAQRQAEATEMTIELRLTPPLVRPNDTPSLSPMLAFSLSEHWWVGAGYQFLQDYDAILWTSENAGHKPIVMSGISAGAWYRGGATHNGTSLAAGGLFTFANPSISFGHSPGTLESGTTVVDFGADFSIGHMWQGFRLEAFATPAWSLGRVASPAIHKNELLSAFTYRIGVALAILVGA